MLFYIWLLLLGVTFIFEVACAVGVPASPPWVLLSDGPFIAYVHSVPCLLTDIWMISGLGLVFVSSGCCNKTQRMGGLRTTNIYF